MIDAKAIRPHSGRLLISRPSPLESGEDTVINGIVIPARSAQRRREYGLIAEVIAVGPEVDPEVTPGCRVIVGEFAGVPIHDGSLETPYWLIGQGEVMAYVG